MGSITNIGRQSKASCDLVNNCMHKVDSGDNCDSKAIACSWSRSTERAPAAMGFWPQQVSDRGALAPACLAHPLPCCCHPQSRSRPSSHAQGPSIQTTNSIGLCTNLLETHVQTPMRPPAKIRMHIIIQHHMVWRITRCRNSPVFPGPQPAAAGS